jgi:hypothetical protein
MTAGPAIGMGQLAPVHTRKIFPHKWLQIGRSRESNPKAEVESGIPAFFVFCAPRGSIFACHSGGIPTRGTTIRRLYTTGRRTMGILLEAIAKRWVKRLVIRNEITFRAVDF